MGDEIPGLMIPFAGTAPGAAMIFFLLLSQKPQFLQNYHCEMLKIRLIQSICALCWGMRFQYEFRRRFDRQGRIGL